MTRKTRAPDPEHLGRAAPPEIAQGWGEDAEETARRAADDAARAENEGYPLGRPDAPDDTVSSTSARSSGKVSGTP